MERIFRKMIVNAIKVHNFEIKLPVLDLSRLKERDYLFLGVKIIPSGHYYVFFIENVIRDYFAFTILKIIKFLTYSIQYT